MTCTADYRVTAADLQSGHDLVNTATATGTTASDDTVTALASEATVTVTPDPSLATTGISVIGPAVTAGVLLLAGVVFLIAWRRRRRSA
jgi:LPXTG-motif cell wall-anchored protein